MASLIASKEIKMKILFIDESKKQDKGNIKEAFVLVGIMINQEKLIEVENKLDEIKERYFVKKIEDIKKITEKEVRLAFSVEIRDVLYNAGCKVLSSIWGEVALNDYDKIEEVYPSCFHVILERFFINLKKEDKKGIMIHDEFGKPYGKYFISKIYNQIKTKEFSCPWEEDKIPYKERIYPQLFFGRDDYSNLLQVADILATTLNYSYRKVKNSLPKDKLYKIKEMVESFKDENEYLQIYWDLFVKKFKTGEVNGFGNKIWI